jgi:hypothetical protein
VRIFIKAVIHAHPNRSFLFEDINFSSYSEGSNFQKLRYWGLIRKQLAPDSKGGWWSITDRGMRFAEGKIFLPSKVWTYRGDVLRFEGKDKYINDITGGWKYRPEYAKEAQPHN